MAWMERCRALYPVLDGNRIEGVLITDPFNVRYFSGHTGGEAWMFVSRSLSCLVTDGRYWAQVEKECPGLEIARYMSHEYKGLADCLAQWLKAHGFVGRVGCEDAHLSHADFLSAQHFLLQSGTVTELAGIGCQLLGLRAVKDLDEAECLRRSAHVADVAWQQTLPIVAEGVSERDFCTELDYHMHKLGAATLSFDTIVASGENGAYPHAKVTERAFKRGELITVDFGACVDGYCSDITRTIWIGCPDDASLKIWDLVKKAHDAAMQAVKPGMSCRELDAIARDIIAQGGYGEYFNHSLGHGVGLQCHEKPALRRESADVLEEGMLCTIEPGIYVPGTGGCRIEDLLLVTAQGYEVLSRAPYQIPGEEHPTASYRR